MVNVQRRAIESLYKGRCSITEYKPVKDEITKITANKEVVVLSDIPCRLSYKNVLSSNSSDYANTVNQEIKLFISPNIDIKSGSKIAITQNGITKDFVRSGEPAVYTNHQEVVLELFGGWC